MLLGQARNFRWDALGQNVPGGLGPGVCCLVLVSFFNEFMKTFIQQFIKFQATVEGGLLEGAHELGRHPELQGNELGG